MERIWFWSKILTREREVSGRVLEAARREWSAATQISQRGSGLPMGRFLYGALKLKDQDPEVFSPSARNLSERRTRDDASG